MDDIVIRGWENFLARPDGPISLRFVLQPAVATLLAIRAGLRDARDGRPAFLWSAFTHPHARIGLLHSSLKDIGGVLLAATILDLVYQLIVSRGIHLLELLFTVFLLAVVPYVLLRGPVNRLTRLLRLRTDAGERGGT